jgi:hypothetical protein
MSNVGKWCITYYIPHLPTSVGLITDESKDAYHIKIGQMGVWVEIWDRSAVKIFDTQEEAQAEYDKFTQNKNNYAYEG